MCHSGADLIVHGKHREDRANTFTDWKRFWMNRSTSTCIIKLFYDFIIRYCCLLSAVAAHTRKWYSKFKLIYGHTVKPTTQFLYSILDDSKHGHVAFFSHLAHNIILNCCQWVSSYVALALALSLILLWMSTAISFLFQTLSLDIHSSKASLL